MPQPQPQPQRADLFARSVLGAIDWSDPVASGSAIYALVGKLLAGVIDTPELTQAEVARLEWVLKLARQLATFRDVAEIEALRRKLTGGDDEPRLDDDGPQMEPVIILADETQEARDERDRRTFRGRPRKRLLA